MVSGRGHDVLVVGAGSAGCALAARLAEAGATVELIEAGPAAESSRAHQDATNCDLSGRLDWRYVGQITNGRLVALPRGRAVGGSSVINTCVALRPDPAAFADWEAITGEWGWSRVLPYFCRLEQDQDFPRSPYHGDRGPVPIVRWREEELESPARSFRNAAQAVGVPYVQDLNAPGTTGVGMIPMNRLDRWRASADRTYLNHGRSSDITVVTERAVDRIIFDGRRATGVTSRGRDGLQSHHASRVVLCAGAYGTPAILLRTGIGPAENLEELQIDVVAELPGVGRGLIDHSQVHLVSDRDPLPQDSPALQVMVRTTTASSTIANDVQLCVLNRVEPASHDPHVPLNRQRSPRLCALLQHSESRGTVRLSCPDPTAPPLIDIDYVATASDRSRYRDALRLLARLSSTSEAQPISPSAEDALADLTDRQLDELVSRRVQTAHHPMGTARMGLAADPEAVVSPDLRVHGLDGLWVADASVVPVCLNSNINLACAMIGERAADMIRD